MKKYIFSLVCLCCALLPALEGQAHEYPNHPELRKSDANIVGEVRPIFIYLLVPIDLRLKTSVADFTLID